jgi:hypothetical protein
VQNKSTARAQLIGVSLFAIAFASAGIAKYGLLLAYLNASGYIALFLAGFGTYQAVKKFDTYLLKHRSTRSTKAAGIRALRPVFAIGTFSALFYLLFFVQPDKLAISYFKGIPIEALYPCTNRPLEPEVEKIAREIFRLREIDRFDDNFCSSES